MRVWLHVALLMSTSFVSTAIAQTPTSREEPFAGWRLPPAESPVTGWPTDFPVMAERAEAVSIYAPQPTVAPVPSASAAPKMDTDAPIIVKEETTGLSWPMATDWGAWFTPTAWDGSLEAGMNATEGNAQAFSFRTGGNLKRKTERWELTTDLIYAKTLSNGIETQHNALFNAGFERLFVDSNWSYFGKTNLEYDEFKAFDLRVVLNAGLGYLLIKNDVTSLKGRFGAGTSHEINGPDDRWVPEAVFGADYSYQLSKRQKFTLVSDYFPEWDDFHNYRLVTNLNWEFLLDEASNLSLKLSVNDRYDSTPNGRKPNDVIYALLLLWKI